MDPYKLCDNHSREIHEDSEFSDNYNTDLLCELIKTKELIDVYPNEWDSIKRMNHQYEYIYTSSNPNRNISNVIPVSRSYFKLIEIIKEYSIFKSGENYKIACIAEAPGGFIQSILHTSKTMNYTKDISAITLLSKDFKVPYWNPIVCNHKDIFLYEGKEKTGDIYQLHIVLDFIRQVGKGSCHLVTGDGGFDYSKDYNNQELSSFQLIYSEILIAINIQKKGGIFVCKLFDLFHTQTRQLLYILYLSYSEIYFHKPSVSRLSNSEKYIICKGFKGYNKEISNYLCHNFATRDVKLSIPDNFIKDIDTYNELYVMKQIQSITMGIHIINNNLKHKSLYYENQIKLAIKWCNKYNIPINNKLAAKVVHPINLYSRWN